MVVVVPSFAACDDSNDDVVATIVLGLVVTIPEQMRKRVAAPRNVPNQNGSNYCTPKPDTGAKLNGFPRCSHQSQTCQKADSKIPEPGSQNNPHEGTLEPSIKSIANDVARISIVCNHPVQVGVLDKQPSHVRPKQTDQGTVWVGTLIGAVVMHAMNCDPPRRRIFKTADRKASKGMFKP